MTAHGAVIRTATTKAARDSAIRTAMVEGGFSTRDVARVLGIRQQSLHKRVHRLGLVYDKETGKWMG